MNADDREELARLLPDPVERNLPGDRHHQLQEFVMSEIHRDPHATRPAPRRPLLRRSLLVTSALTAVAAVAASIGVAVTGQSGDGQGPPAPVAQTGREILLAAANTAQQQPEGTGKYWYVKVVYRIPAKNVVYETETWVDREGTNWIRYPDGMPDPNNRGQMIYTPVKWGGEPGFSLAGPHITFAELQGLPTSADALKAAVTQIMRDKGQGDDGGKVAAEDLEERVIYALIGLVSQLPAPPKVRAAAFQAIAAYPNVVNLGPVEGGQALQIPVLQQKFQARLVIDPVTARVRETNLVVKKNSMSFVREGGSSTIESEWTDTLPA